MKAKTGDCFLMQGSTIEEPMSLYLVKEILGEKIIALSVCINNQMVQSLEPWDSLNTYDNDIPTEAIFLPTDTYDIVKKMMMDFLDDTWTYVEAHLDESNTKNKIEVGKHYYCDGYIYTVKRNDGNRIKCLLFRLERENISPYWSSEDNFDSAEKRFKPISGDVYEEVKHRYEDFVQNLREYLFYKK